MRINPKMAQMAIAFSKTPVFLVFLVFLVFPCDLLTCFVCFDMLCSYGWDFSYDTKYHTHH